MTSLAILSLADNRLATLPKDIWKLRDLALLDIEGNPELNSKLPPGLPTNLLLQYLHDMQHKSSKGFIFFPPWPSFLHLVTFSFRWPIMFSSPLEFPSLIDSFTSPPSNKQPLKIPFLPYRIGSALETRWTGYPWLFASQPQWYPQLIGRNQTWQQAEKRVKWWQTSEWRQLHQLWWPRQVER